MTTILLCKGPAGSSGIGGVLPEAWDDTEGGAGGAGEPGEGEGAGEEGAAQQGQRARDIARQTEEDRAAAQGGTTGGRRLREEERGAQLFPLWSQTQGAELNLQF